MPLSFTIGTRGPDALLIYPAGAGNVQTGAALVVKPGQVQRVLVTDQSRVVIEAIPAEEANRLTQ